MVLYIFRCGSEKRIRHALLRLSKATLIQEHTGSAFYVLTKFNLSYSKWCVVQNIFKHSPHLHQCILMPRHQHNIKKPTFLKHEPQNNNEPKCIL